LWVRSQKWAPGLTPDKSLTSLKELPMAATRRSMIVRMFRLMDKIMDQMEQSTNPDTQRDADLMGKLVSTLGKLIEIDRTSGKLAAPRQTKDMLDIRDRLVQRIAELKRD
jgi:hypothetical protein